LDPLKRALELTLTKYPMLTANVVRDVVERKDSDVMKDDRIDVKTRSCTFRLVMDEHHHDDSTEIIGTPSRSTPQQHDHHTKAHTSGFALFRTATTSAPLEDFLPDPRLPHSSTHFYHRPPHSISKSLLPHLPDSFLEHIHIPQDFPIMSATYLQSTSTTDKFSALAVYFPHLVCDGASVFHIVNDWARFYRILVGLECEDEMTRLERLKGGLDEDLLKVEERIAADNYRHGGVAEWKEGRLPDEEFERSWNAYKVVNPSVFAHEYAQPTPSNPKNLLTTTDDSLEYPTPTTQARVFFFSTRFLSTLKSLLNSHLTASCQSPFLSTDDCLSAFIVSHVFASRTTSSTTHTGEFQRSINIRPRLQVPSNAIGNLTLVNRNPAPPSFPPNLSTDAYLTHLSTYASILRSRATHLPVNQQLEFLERNHEGELGFSNDLAREDGADFVLSSWIKFPFSGLDFGGGPCVRFDGEGILGLQNLTEVVGVEGGVRLQVVLKRDELKRLEKEFELGVERVMKYDKHNEGVK
ncbi:hypothetical protein HDV05_006288, partial [Chytridiales sp. JEL 0842]